MNSFYRLLSNKHGFSLVETMIAAALAAGVALTVAKIGQESSRVSKTMETNLEINQAMNDIAYILSDKESCNATVGAGSPVNGDVTGIVSVNDTGSTTKYVKNQKYGNGAFSIVDMDTVDAGSGNVDLEIIFRRENKVAYGSQEIKKKIPLKAVVNSGNIESCFSDTENMIEEAARKACYGSTARWDDSLKQCFHDISSTTCPSGKVMINMAGSSDPNGGPIEPLCVDPIQVPQSCPAGSYVKSVSSSGIVTCDTAITAASCSAGQYAWVDGSRKVTCRDIPPCVGGVLRTLADNSLNCRQLKCNDPNEYFVGINADGSLDCRQIPHNTCGAGKYIRSVDASGVIQCDTIPPSALGTVGANEYVKGYNTSTGSIVPGSFPVCPSGQFLTSNGSGLVCAAPPSPTGDDHATICAKFPGFTWNGSQCQPPSDQVRIYSFAVSYNGSTWNISSTYVSNSYNATDKGVNAVLESVSKPDSCRHVLRIHFNGYYLDSTEVLAMVYNNANAQVGMGVQFWPDGNNNLHLVKRDDLSCNAFSSGDRLNFTVMIPRM